MAWRFVSWALKQKVPEVHIAVHKAFEIVLHGKQQPKPPEEDGILEQHGILGKRSRWECQEEACNAVIIPSAKALLKM